MNSLESSIARAMLDESFEIQVRNAGVFRFPAAYRFERHNHWEIEVNYINNGACIMGINGEFLPLRRGDCLIIYPGVKHQFLVDARENCRITQLEFTVHAPKAAREALPFLKTETEYQKLSGCESISCYMESLCRIFRTQEEKEKKETLLHLGFFQLFIELSGSIEQKQKAPKKGKAGKISEIIAYINENCEKPINMEKLAAQYGVSSRYIRKCFQQEIGMNFQKYICTMRIGKAKELLWFSSKSATDIALETGFGSSQYFCRVFQQYTEMTPMEYRNLWKGQKAEELCVVDTELNDKK